EVFQEEKKRATTQASATNKLIITRTYVDEVLQEAKKNAAFRASVDKILADFYDDDFILFIGCDVGCYVGNNYSYEHLH
ncbi:13863_t:CDS:2, partial [Dentiscutata erythropus]